MKKHFLLFVATLLPVMAFGDASGSCGDHATWKYIESSKTLVIGGTGPMKDFIVSDISWYDYRGSIRSIVVSSGITTIGNYSFYNLFMVSSVIIPNSVTSIGQGAFQQCSSLTSITIPTCVTSIGKDAFQSCTGLLSITIPNNVTSIKDGVFYGCTRLSSITIPNSVTSIGEMAFSGCSNLTSITIPNSVETIGEIAFSSCSALASVIIGNSVSNIGKWAFWGCSKLKNVYCYAEQVPSSGSDIFKYVPITAAILHVPAESLYAYQTISPWCNFRTIIILTDNDSQPTGVKRVEPMTVVPANNYDLNGRKLMRYPATKGLYIINKKKVLTKSITSTVFD